MMCAVVAEVADVRCRGPQCPQILGQRINYGCVGSQYNAACARGDSVHDYVEGRGCQEK